MLKKRQMTDKIFSLSFSLKVIVQIHILSEMLIKILFLAYEKAKI